MADDENDDEWGEAREQMVAWMGELRIKASVATSLVDSIIAYMDEQGLDEFDDFIDELASSDAGFSKTDGVKPGHLKKLKDGALKIRDSRSRSSTRSRASWSSAQVAAPAPEPAPSSVEELLPVLEPATPPPPVQEPSAPAPASAAPASKPVVNGFVLDAEQVQSSGKSYVVTGTHEVTGDVAKIKVIQDKEGFDREVRFLKKVPQSLWAHRLLIQLTPAVSFSS